MNYYLETDSVNPYYNLAFEEYILLNKKEGDFLMLWQNDKTIVIGQNQNTEEEINKKYTIVIPAGGFKDMGVEWYGPAFLYSIYGGTIED